ncbi:unnamed protein product, partial [Mesorhabditis belari]|uniref:USP domain-containing protein n=1 Tax=Mesorhabditis belari TaxID=2138241 RepID=A0AAF3J1Y1_9BILA
MYTAQEGVAIGGDALETQWLPQHTGTYRYHQPLATSLTQNPVANSALRFDPYEELLWAGTTAGRVYSYGDDFARYTAFGVTTHFSDKSPTVQSIEFTEDYILSLTNATLKANTRQGLSVFNHESPHMHHLSAMLRLPDAPNSLLMGGNQDRLLQFDLVTLKDQRVHILRNEKSAMIIRANDKNIFLGTRDGRVAVLNPKTFETVKVIEAHANLTDFDVSGNRLITCGQSVRGGTLHGDPYVKVYDLRTHQAMQPIPWGHTPRFCRFFLSYCDTRVILVGRDGPSQIVDLNSTVKEPLFQATSSTLESFDYSPSRQAIAFGTMFGEVNVWFDREEPVFNENAFETVFADPPCGPPQSFLYDDTTTPLAAVPLPFSPDDWLLSDWPEELCRPNYKVPRMPFRVSNITTRQFVGYAKNPLLHLKLKNFNLVPYVVDGTEETIEQVLAPPTVPTFYQKKMNTSLTAKRLTREFDERILKGMNSTDIPSVEPNSGSGFANPLTLLLYAVVPLRNLALNHLCQEELCLCCELGFLFRIYSDQKEATPVSTNNLMRALRGLEFKNESTNIPTLIHQFFCFILSNLHENLLETEHQLLETLLRTQININAKCVRCTEIQTFEEELIGLSLEYPEGCSRFGLTTLYEKALIKRRPTDSYCAKCDKDTIHERTAKVKSLPPILLIETNPATPGFESFWLTKIHEMEKRIPYVNPLRLFSLDGKGSDATPCRYGGQCRHQDTCKFRHPPNASDWSKEVDAWIEVAMMPPIGENEWVHIIPEEINIRLSQGIPIINDQPTNQETDVYKLCAMVSMIGNGEEDWPHAVAQIREGSSDEWLVSNELLVTRVPSKEALHVDYRWKLPSVLAYVRTDYMDTKEGARALVPDTIFSVDTNLTGNHEIARDRRARLAPNFDDIVALDAEFIDVNEDIGRKSIARLSCVDGRDGQVIMDDHVATCPGDNVGNYLTHVSGIIRDDLDPITSTKHLTTLKTVYLKILNLVQKDVKFVGHALSNDFSALNLYVPPNQILDTVHLFRDRAPQCRMLSLQFLAYHLLNEKIQQNIHDSVEDARIALQLYRKWEELNASGDLEKAIQQLYETGKQCNWRAGGSNRGRQSSSPEQSTLSNASK